MMNSSLLSGILWGEVEAGQRIILFFKMVCNLLYIPRSGFKLMQSPCLSLLGAGITGIAGNILSMSNGLTY